MKDPERFERLMVDIDTRLAGLWANLWDTELFERLEDDDRALIASSLRAAYGLGYADYHHELEAGRPAELARANGYRKES